MTNHNKEWRKRNPVKVAAHTILAWAVRSGKVQRQPCERCEAPKAHGHHHDYSKPLDVTWLCAKCHGKEHRQPREERAKRTYPLATQRKVAKETAHMRAVNRATRRVGNKVKATYLRAQGLSYSQIATTIGVSTGTAYKLVNNTPYN